MLVSFFIFIGALAVLLVLFVLGYNRLIRLRNSAQNAWADLDVQLQRRHDLIPNVVSTVGGYAGHERGTLDEITQARASAIAARNPATPGASGQAEGQLTGALGRLFADEESYPQLKADETFTLLQSQLAGTEQGIALARQAYNDSVQAYNNAVQTFPFILVAWFGSFAPLEFHHTDDAGRALPDVAFVSPSSAAPLTPGA